MAVVKASTFFGRKEIPDAVASRAKSFMAARVSLQELVLKEAGDSWQGERRDEDGNLLPRQGDTQEKSNMKTFTLKSNSIRNKIVSFPGFGGAAFSAAFDVNGCAQIPAHFRPVVEQLMTIRQGRFSILEEAVMLQAPMLIEVASEARVQEEENLLTEETDHEDAEELTQVKPRKGGRGKTAKKE